MSKFVLLFVVICLLATVAFAEEGKRQRRDLAEEAKNTAEKAGDMLKDLFKEENWNKALDSAKDFGAKLKEAADDLVAKISKPAAAK